MTYPGAFIYHCAVASVDYHISSGMRPNILVEPEEGLPAVDREFYLGQMEVYTNGTAESVRQRRHYNSVQEDKRAAQTRRGEADTQPTYGYAYG